MVDRSLSTYRRIHLSKQCGWDLYEINTTLECCCDETTEVADNTTAQGNQTGRAVMARFQQERCNRLKAGKIFIGLAILQLIDIYLPLTKSAEHLV